MDGENCHINNGIDLEKMVGKALERVLQNYGGFSGNWAEIVAFL